MTDFERLMQGTVKLSDFGPVQIEAIKQEYALKMGVDASTVDLEQIKDTFTREAIKRWDKYFPA